jgi:glycosyltransferase involved in cell wall biosynthesis
LAHLLPRRATTRLLNPAHADSQRTIETAALRVRRIAQGFQPDVVHSYTLHLHTEVCLRAGVAPLVVSAWGYLNSLMANRPTDVDRRWIHRLRKDAHTVLVENPQLHKVLSAKTLDPLQLDCFPLGVDSKRFHPDYQDEAAAWRFVLGIPSDAVVLLSPRGWSHIYGQAHIMQAFANAYGRLNRPLVLVLLGVGRMARPEILAQEVLDLAARLGVGHAIRWIPQVPHEDMPGIYALADVVVNYPSSDAFPSTLLEAAACARPIVSSDLPAYRNTFIERYCRLVEPENPTALADTLVDLLAADSDTRAVGVQQARLSVLADYDEGVQKQRLLSLYSRIAKI